MSLNGLDHSSVTEAYEAGAAEAGAWFLLKYESRDEVALLARGNDGIAEVRNAIAAYEETSPLFGFLKYRRKNVIIKYLPEDCSRLIQARVAVHLTAVCERFSPYDTLFEISSAKQLRDSKLSAACSLHATSRSNSTTSSSRKKHMSEIAEEEEEDEEQRANKRHSTLDNADEQPATKRQSLHRDKGDDTADGRPHSPPADPVKLNADLAASPENSKFSAIDTSAMPNFTGIDDRRPTSSSAKTIDVGRRMSSQTTRPDLFTYSTYGYSKPKVKLGPRPSLDVGARPQTAGNFRPVSQIPAGFKLFGKGAKKGKNKDDASATEPQEEVPELNFPTVPAAPSIPGESRGLHTEPVRPATSSGVSTTSTIMPGQIKPAMSREKARLMKAKKLREQKKKQKSDAESTEVEPTPTIPGTQSVQDGGLSKESTEAQAENEGDDVETETTSMAAKRQSIVKADSAVAIDTLSSGVHADQESEKTQSDSRPVSPVIASSEPDESTKASSISDSTDETVRGKDGEEVKEENAKEIDTPEEIPCADFEAPNETPAKTELKDLAEAALQVDAIEETEEIKQGETESAEDVDEASDEKDDHGIVDGQSSESAAEGTTLIEMKLDASESRPLEIEESIVTTASETQHDSQASQQDDEDTKLQHEQSADLAEEQSLETADNIPDSEENPLKPVTSRAPSETANIPETQPDEVARATDDDNEVQVEPLKVPKSKFSTQDLRARAGSLATDAPPVPQPDAKSGFATGRTAFKKEERVVDEENAQDVSERDSLVPQQVETRRKILVEPIRTDLATHSRQTSHSDTNFLDDEALMEELQSATVQEAKPMIVAKTPVTPGFPAAIGNPQSPTTPGGTPYVVRTVSNPIRSAPVLPQDISQSSARSMSSGAAYLHKITQQQQSGDKLSTKSNMGSRISQRIKALEMLSVPASETGSQNGGLASARERPSSRFFSVGKSREASRSPSVVERASSFRKQTPPSAVASRDVSPEHAAVLRRRERSGSVASRLSMFESPVGSNNNNNGHSPGAHGVKSGSESISVTARIVRDPNQHMHKASKDHGHLDLKQSPLLVDHQRVPDHETEPAYEGLTSRDSRRAEPFGGKGVRRRRSSLHIVKDFIKESRKSLSSPPPDVLGLQSRSPSSLSRPPSTHQNHSIASRLSLSGRRSMSRDGENPVSPSVLSEGSGSGDDTRSFTSDKKRGSRAGRLMRRLSSLSGSRGKISSPPGISPTVTEEPPEPMPQVRPSTTPAPATAMYLGDVNVQFPDTLLWKRRNMSLDTQGFLVLSAAAQSQVAARPPPTQGTKRYHMSEFRAPYAPDVEVQELPNSVVLDLMEGSGVQIACEDRFGQMNILQILQKAHATHAARFGP